MPRRLTIGLVIDDSLDTNGGVQQYVRTLGRFFEGRGHVVYYLAGHSETSEFNNMFSLSRNVSVVYNRNRLSIPLPVSRKKLKRLLSEVHFDVLHIQTPYSPMLAGRLVNLAPKSTAIFGTFHIMPYSKMVRLGTKTLGVLEQGTLKKFDRMYAASPAVKQFAESSLRLDCEILPVPVAIKQFQVAKPVYKPRGKFMIVFLGRLVPRKGCGLLIEAAGLLNRANEITDFEVVICGGGPLMASLIKQAKDTGIGDKVKFAGAISEAEKPAYYASADLTIFPAASGESFGIVLVEAMASGRAVVLAGDNPGYSSVMEGRPELLFDATDAHELADKIRHYLLNPDARKREAVWGKNRAKVFDIERVGLELEASYIQVATSKQSKA